MNVSWKTLTAHRNQQERVTSDCKKHFLSDLPLSQHEEALNGRCLTLEIQWDPWQNGIRTNQCNHAGVLKNGDKETQSACLLARAPGSA